MALKAVVDTLDGVAGELASHYVLRDGKYYLTVEGMRTEADVQRVQSSLEKERTDHKELRDKYRVLGDRKPEDILASLERIPELEATIAATSGSPDPAKIEALVETRVNARIAPLQRENETLKIDLIEKTVLVSKFEENDTRRTIADDVRRAATATKMLPEAIDDAIMLAERNMEVVDGVPRVKSGVGGTLAGSDATVYLTDLQKTRPHWWPASQGGGANGGNPGNGGVVNPWSKANWNITAQGAMIRDNRERAEQMAKAAGSYIGATAPKA